MADKFGFKQGLKEFERLKKTLPKIIGNDARAFFQDSFKKQGFDDSTIEKWKSRKNDKTKRQRGRAILVKSGRLRRSIKLRHVSWDKILISTDVPYAEAHNEGSRKVVYVKPHKRQNVIRTKVSGGFEGTSVKRRSKTIEILGSRVNVSGYSYKQNIPQRRFMGDSRKLNTIITATLAKEIDRIFK